MQEEKTNITKRNDIVRKTLNHIRRCLGLIPLRGIALGDRIQACVALYCLFGISGEAACRREIRIIPLGLGLRRNVRAAVDRTCRERGGIRPGRNRWVDSIQMAASCGGFRSGNTVIGKASFL